MGERSDGGGLRGCRRPRARALCVSARSATTSAPSPRSRVARIAG